MPPAQRPQDKRRGERCRQVMTAATTNTECQLPVDCARTLPSGTSSEAVPLDAVMGLRQNPRRGDCPPE
jgi:hypothetical protein